ncbi:MAG: PcfB family protein, partial [Oscillospiraceae bacterium]|nr:PcfB family protein [Oscillospiraceae bacterium]
MQDEVRDKSVALTIKVGKTGGKLTAELLKWAIRQYMQQSRNPNIHHGKQSVKQLVRQGAGVKNIEITDKNIKSFERVAKKYGVDFALKKDPAEGKYYVFFKARD